MPLNNLSSARSKQLLTGDENRFTDACPRDTVERQSICFVRPVVTKVERWRTVVWRNFCSTGQRPRVNLQFYSVIGLKCWGIAEKRPCYRLPADWCRYCSVWPCSSCRPIVVGHAAGQGHVLTLEDRSTAGDSARWSRIWDKFQS